jgi:large subunit ribosomal protein L23
MRGKQKRVGRHVGRTQDWKKAYVTLSEGEISFVDEL